MDDVAARLPGRTNGPGSAVRRSEEEAAIRRLAAATRVEDRPVQEDERPLPALVDREYMCLRRAGVGVRVTELPGNVHLRPPT